MKHIFSFGEILVDRYIENGKITDRPGGAPFNVACNITHFGGDVTFVGSVGNDELGNMLSNFANDKVNDTYIDKFNEYDTSIAEVSLKDGERSFRFLRDNGADYHFDLSSIVKNIDIKNSIIHIGSLMLSTESGRESFYKIKDYALKNNCILSFDINYREDIFKDANEAKMIYLEAMKNMDYLKFSEDEIATLSNEEDLVEGIKKLVTPNQNVFISLGSKGSMYYRDGKFVNVDTYKVKPLDTTGAGDAFYSYILFTLQSNTFEKMDYNEIVTTLLKANVAGGLATLKYGAIDAAPSLKEIDQFIKEKEKE